jgi:galactokinase
LGEHAVAFAPGRANLIGEHTDYNDGLALPFAISEGVTIRAQALPERRIEAVASDLGERDGFELRRAAAAGGWRAFVRGAAAELQRAGIELAGARRPDRTELAKLCSRVENEWVGAQTGLLDQLASLYGERDRALRIDFRSLDVDPVELELDGYRLVTLDSGQRHEHAGSGYNERRAECARACELLGVRSLRDATLEMAATLPPPLAQRARHVITENDRVEDAVEALRHGDLERVGALIDASHASLRDCYEVSTPAVEETVRRLRDGGAIGARIVGGGFGGNVLALLPPDARAPDGAIEVRPGPGARLLD